MSYADEHNIREIDRETANSSGSSSETPSRTRHQPTLSTFLNTPSISGLGGVSADQTASARIQAFINYIGGNPELLQTVALSENVISFNGLNGSSESKGVDNLFLDTLERVNVKSLKQDDACPICTNDYKSDPYPLVVELPCNRKHRFDLECIGPWLKMNRTCPLCRVDVTVNKNKVELVDSEEEEDGWDMYG